MHILDKKVKQKKLNKELTDEEMALPGFQPSDEELGKWLDKPEIGRGSKAEVVRKRLIKMLNS